MPRAKKAVTKKVTKKISKKTIANKKTSPKKRVTVKKVKETNENIFIKLLLVIVIASLLLLSLVHLMSKATIRTKTWDGTYKNYPELLNKNAQSGNGFFAEFLKENGIAANDDNYKIFKEFKNYDGSKRAILFGEKTDKEARGIFIMDNKENRATEFEYLENKKYNYLSNVIWMDANRLAYDKIIENEDGIIPERNILGKNLQNGLPTFLDWSNYESNSEVGIPLDTQAFHEHGFPGMDLNSDDELSTYITEVKDEVRTYNYNDYLLTIAPNINNWTIEEYDLLTEEYVIGISNSLLGIVNDGELLLWADRCAGAGVRLREDDHGYEEQVNCFAAEEEILKYFK